MSDIESVLKERGSRYGEFDEHARITQSIKSAMVSGRSWNSCSPAMKEALEMIAHKIGRIVNGDPSYLDSWVDIGGYNALVVKELQARQVAGAIIPIDSQEEFDRVTSMSPAEYRRWQEEAMKTPSAGP